MDLPGGASRLEVDRELMDGEGPASPEDVTDPDLAPALAARRERLEQDRDEYQADSLDSLEARVERALEAEGR